VVGTQLLAVVEVFLLAFVDVNASFLILVQLVTFLAVATEAAYRVFAVLRANLLVTFVDVAASFLVLV
jgi:hypothetical protein